MLGGILRTAQMNLDYVEGTHEFWIYVQIGLIPLLNINKPIVRNPSSVHYHTTNFHPSAASF